MDAEHKLIFLRGLPVLSFKQHIQFFNIILLNFRNNNSIQIQIWKEIKLTRGRNDKNKGHLQNGFNNPVFRSLRNDLRAKYAGKDTAKRLQSDIRAERRLQNRRGQ